MYKNSKSKEDEIIKLYKEGVMLTKICELTTSSQLTIKKVLSHNGIDYNLNRKKTNQEKLDKALELYKQGKSQLFIEKELGFTRKTLRKLFKDSEVVYRDKSDQQHIRCKTEINHACFDILTPESLYWIGMLYADGHITENIEYSIELTQHKDDIEHLKKFKEFLKSTRPITKGNGDCKRVRVNSKYINLRLRKLGFTHNKSYTGKPHDLFKNSIDFWRGCVDGDGGLYHHPSGKKSTIAHIFLCGTLDTILNFIQFCVIKIGVTEKKPTFTSKGNGLYRVSYYGEEAQKIAKIFYKDSTIYLDRKYKTYLEWTQE